MTRTEFDALVNDLALKVKNNQPISSNPMLDGMAIGLLIYNSDIVFDIIDVQHIGRLSDGKIQQLQLITKWLTDCNIINF